MGPQVHPHRFMFKHTCLRCIVLILLVICTLLSFAQHDIARYELKNINNPVIPMITNRMIDSVQQGWRVLSNRIDNRNSLKVFIADARGDSIYCNRVTTLSLSYLFSQPGNDWVLLIHGDSKAPVDAAVRGLEVQNLHNVKVLVFSWPSKMSTQNGLKNFRNSKGNVRAGLAHFRELLLTMQKYRNSHIWPEENNLSLFMHSLGNYYLELSVKEGMLEGIDADLFDNVIINAAAVELEGHKAWVENVKISERIYIISNARDFNLSGARLFTSAGKQLGGPLEQPLAENAIYINFTEAVGFKLPTWVSHTYFVGEMPSKSSNIKNFYSTIFHGHEKDLNNQKMFKPRPDELGVDIIE